MSQLSLPKWRKLKLKPYLCPAFNAGDADHSPTSSFSGKRKIFLAGKFLIGREGKWLGGWEDVGK